MENEKNYAQNTKSVKNWMENSEIKNLGGYDMETKDQVVTVENKVVTGFIGMDAEEREKFYRDTQVAQNNAFLEVDQNDFVEHTRTIEIYNEIQNVKESGAFIPINGLTPLYKDRNTGIMILAKRIAIGGGLGNPVIVFVYPDKTTSEEVEIKMSELIEIIGGNHVKADDIDKADAKKMMKKVIGRISSYWDLDMEIRIEDLITILVANLSKIKVDEGNELTFKKVYAAIDKYVEEESWKPDNNYMKRKAVFALTSEDMTNIITYLGMGVKLIDIIDILKRNNMLYLQKSSIGNQCEVKDKGSCYCVRILAKYKHEDYVDFNYDPNDRL